MQSPCTLLRLAAASGAILLANSATAQFTTNFENVTASAAGTLLTGQDGYYVPVATSVDFLAYAYTGNALGIPQNPNGSDNFIAGTGPGGGIFGRAQRDMSYDGGGGVWTAGFDVLVTFTGTLPSAQNAGSFSIQPFPGSQNFIALARWVDPNTATNWNADYVWFDATGAQLTESVADVAFQNLAVDSWYRWETDFDLTTNEILEVRVTDLATNTTATNNPVGRYMEGGTAGSAVPTGFRFFAGGGVDGNTLAFDNANIEREYWSDGFESYLAPTALEGQGGWKGWDGNNTADTQVQSAVVHSGSNAISLTVGSDTVHEYAKTTGVWNYTGQIYIPTGWDGSFAFMIMNDYSDGGPKQWGSEIDFNGATASPANTVVCLNGGGNTPIVFDQWVEIRKKIDLTNDTFEVWYGGVSIGNYAYHTGYNGAQNHAVLGIEAIDIFPFPAFGSTPFYVDDLALTEDTGEIGTTFQCPATVPNSSGGPASILATGSSVAADNDVTLTATGLPTIAPTPGYFLNSALPSPGGFALPGSQGRLCIDVVNIGRYNTAVFNAAGTGEASLVLDLANTPTASGPVAIQSGETWYFTAWFRDQNPNSTSNLSDAVCITFQ